MTWQLNVYDGGGCVDIDNIQSGSLVLCVKINPKAPPSGHTVEYSDILKTPFKTT